jgi:hypothetical protein
VKIRSIAAAIAVAGAVMIGASGCDAGPPCVRGHYDYELMPMAAGKVITLVLEPVWHCDEYAPETPSK